MGNNLAELICEALDYREPTYLKFGLVKDMPNFRDYLRENEGNILKVCAYSLRESYEIRDVTYNLYEIVPLTEEEGDLGDCISGCVIDIPSTILNRVLDDTHSDVNLFVHYLGSCELNVYVSRINLREERKSEKRRCELRPKRKNVVPMPRTF